MGVWWSVTEVRTMVTVVIGINRDNGDDDDGGIGRDH